jgi:hypothetical protein
VEIHHVIVLFIVVVLALLSQRYGNKGRIQELKKIVEPLGFDVKRELDAKSSEYVYHHKLHMGLWMYIRAVCIADNGFTRIVAMDLMYRLDDELGKHYFLGIDSAISAPLIVIKRRTPSTKSMWTASWEDVLFQLDFNDDPEFDKKFIVRGETEETRGFLNPKRRKALCEATDVPDSFSVYGDSVFLEFDNMIEEATFKQNLGKCLAAIRLVMDPY